MTTKEHRYLQEDELIRRPVAALLQAPGPVETARFLNLPPERRRDAVERHREWQESLDKERLFDEVFSIGNQEWVMGDEDQHPVSSIQHPVSSIQKTKALPSPTGTGASALAVPP